LGREWLYIQYHLLLTRASCSKVADVDNSDACLGEYHFAPCAPMLSAYLPI
jgi:hypothetical protein